MGKGSSVGPGAVYGAGTDPLFSLSSSTNLLASPLPLHKQEVMDGPAEMMWGGGVIS